MGSAFVIWPYIHFILVGLLMLMGLYCMYMFIKLATKAIEALQIYIDERRNRRL